MSAPRGIGGGGRIQPDVPRHRVNVRLLFPVITQVATRNNLQLLNQPEIN